ncbi:hypothetical protein ACGI42_23380 [Escherichia coli]|uniref:hypothetical protein n=1 Tax=Escherichia coli TaxID=562 RepID=UPI002739B617|nr:hypothetical protein [Escherichia coli]
MQETKENIRKQLYGFYIAYDLWLSNGAKPGGVFSKKYGLCANLFDYLTSIGIPSEAALEQLHTDFRSAGLNEVLPFNESKGHYYEEKGNNMCHMNPARAAWVRAQMVQAVPDGLVKAVRFYEQVKRENPPVETGAWKDAVDWVLKEACCAVILGKADNPLASSNQVGELTMLIKQLVSQLRKAKPDCKLPEKAMVYLKRNGLISAEDILR